MQVLTGERNIPEYWKVSKVAVLSKDGSQINKLERTRTIAIQSPIVKRIEKTILNIVQRYFVVEIDPV